MLYQKLSARSHRHENADSRIYGFVVKSINFSFLFHRIELLTKPIGHDEELTILGQLRHPLHLLLDKHLVLLLYTAIWKITMFHCKKSNNVLSKNCPFLFYQQLCINIFYYRNENAIPSATVFCFADLAVNQEMVEVYEKDLHVAFHSQKHDSYLCFSTTSAF